MAWEAQIKRLEDNMYRRPPDKMEDESAHETSGPEVLKFFSCSTPLSTKFQMLMYKNKSTDK